MRSNLHKFSDKLIQYNKRMQYVLFNKLTKTGRWWYSSPLPKLEVLGDVVDILNNVVYCVDVFFELPLRPVVFPLKRLQSSSKMCTEGKISINQI